MSTVPFRPTATVVPKCEVTATRFSDTFVSFGPHVTPSELVAITAWGGYAVVPPTATNRAPSHVTAARDQFGSTEVLCQDNPSALRQIVGAHVPDG